MGGAGAGSKRAGPVGSPGSVGRMAGGCARQLSAAESLSTGPDGGGGAGRKQLALGFWRALGCARRLAAAGIRRIGAAAAAGGCLRSFTPPAGSRPAAHARPGPVWRLGWRASATSPYSVTYCRPHSSLAGPSGRATLMVGQRLLCRLLVPAVRFPPRHSPKRRAGRPDGRIAPTVTHCVWLRLPPAPVSHRAVGSGRPPVPVPACARWASLHPPPARFLSRRHTGRGARSPPVSTCAPSVGSHPPPARFYSRLWPGRRVVFRAVTAGSGHSRRVALAANWTGELERAG